MMIPRIKLQKSATMMPTITRTPPTPMPPANLPPRLPSIAIPLLLSFAVCGPQAVPVRTLPCSTDASFRRRASASSKSPCVTDAAAESLDPVRVIAASAASCASDLRSAGEKLLVRAARAARSTPTVGIRPMWRRSIASLSALVRQAEHDCARPALDGRPIPAAVALDRGEQMRRVELQALARCRRLTKDVERRGVDDLRDCRRRHSLRALHERVQVDV